MNMKVDLKQPKELCIKDVGHADEIITTVVTRISPPVQGSVTT